MSESFYIFNPYIYHHEININTGRFFRLLFTASKYAAEIAKLTKAKLIFLTPISYPFQDRRYILALKL